MWGRKRWGLGGKNLPLHGHESVQYRSVFGEVEIERAYYWKEGAGEGHCPLDAELNLPERKDSYLLQEWALRMGVADSFDQTRGGIRELLGLELPKRQLETEAVEAGQAGREFYDQKQAPKPGGEGEVLVVQADGKGVPMKKAVPAQAPPRLAKGEKRQKKKMAWVGTVYTAQRRQPDEEDPRARNKEVFAELEKRERFAGELLQRAAARSKGPRRRAFLGDGQDEIWEMQEEHFPDYIPILDWMHATEYLWKAAYLMYPESSPEAHAWVDRQKKRFRTGRAKDVIRELRRLVKNETIRGKEHCKVAERIAKYYQRHLKRMRYDRYRRIGLPIGSGAVEGTCRHLVKDRMERSGMRWTVSGAQAMLQMRGIYLSGHWESFWKWYRKREVLRLYGKTTPVGSQTSRKVAA